MSILASLNAYTLELRKTRNPLAPVFQQIQAGASASAKERALDAEVTDADAIAALKKAEKNARDMISVLSGQGVTSGDNRYDNAQTELQAIQALLPSKASLDEVRAVAEAYLDGQERNMKAMGGTMAHLRAKFGDSLDNAEASTVVRSLLV